MLDILYSIPRGLTTHGDKVMLMTLEEDEIERGLR